MNPAQIPAMVATLMEFSPAGGCGASVFVDAGRPAGFAITRRMYGKFTEHLGANVYQGAWAQLLMNPGCEPNAVWGNPWGDNEEQIARHASHLKEWKITGFDPAETREAGLGFLWKPLNEDGKFGLDAGVNGTAQRMSADKGKRAGIVTPVFVPVHRCRKLKVSLWAKGQPGAELSVGLTPPRSPAAPLCRTRVRLTAAWKKHALTLTVPAGRIARGAPAFFGIVLEKGGMAWVDQVMAFPADHRDGWDPDVIRYMKEARIPLIRFPGGNFVSGYHWEDGVGDVDARPAKPNPAWAGVEWNHVGTDEWLAFCELIEAEPMICINAGDGTPEEAARWVKHCRGKVKLWEAGNELYGNWQIGFTDAKGYADRYAEFARAMREADPRIRLIANGDTPEWHRELVRRNGRSVESISAHYLPLHQVPRDTPPETVARELVADASNFFARYLRPRAEPMADAGLEPKLALTELQILNRWNATAIEILYYSAIMNECIRAGNVVELVTHSALINHGAGLVKRRSIVAPQPQFWAQWLYSTQPGVTPVPVSVEGPVFGSEGKWAPKAESVSYVDAIALLGKDGRTLTVLLTNRHPRDAVKTAVVIAGFRARGRAEVALLAPDDLMHVANLDDPDELKPAIRKTGVRDGMLELDLPKHSITRVVLRL